MHGGQYLLKEWLMFNVSGGFALDLIPVLIGKGRNSHHHPTNMRALAAELYL